MPRLKLLKGTASWTELTLDSFPVRIGRDRRTCEVLFADETVSRFHAEIIRQGNKCFIIDYRARAGVGLNNQRLKRNCRYPLHSGDLIQICHFVIQYLEDPDEQEHGSDSVSIEETDSSSFSSILESASESWITRKGVNPEAKLTAIVRLTQNLRGCKSLEELLGRVLASLLQVFEPAYRGVVVLQESRHKPSVSRYVRHREGAEEDTAIVSAATVIADAMKRQIAMLADDRTMMCAPLLDALGEGLGIIQLDTRGGKNRFTTEDLDLLATIAVEVSFAVDNWILHEVAMREGQMQFELQIANEVQIGLLPSAPPEVDGYDFFDYYSPAKQVGGDHYDYLLLDDNKLAFVLGDVSGKGVPAALLMAKISSEMSVYLANGLGPRDVVERVNPRFEKHSPAGTFVTMIVAILDLETGEVALVNAGHMPPLLRASEGKVAEIRAESPALPLGIYAVQRYEEFRFTIGRGETLVLFSDGVTDATNSQGNWYGDDRLRAQLTKSSGTAADIGNSIMRQLHDFVDDHQQTDDICLVCIRRQP